MLAEAAAPPVAKTPPAARMNGESAAALLHGLACAVGRASLEFKQDPDEAIAGGADAVSRKDKSLGLLCDNFLQLFASGYSEEVELESVAERLGVGRRRIYDIVNVLESLEVVQKGKSSRYKWLGISRLPLCIAALEREWMSTEAPPTVKLLLDEARPGSQDKENMSSDTVLPCQVQAAGPELAPGASAAEVDRDERGRKEKSIRELSIKFIGLFLQAASQKQLEGVLSLEQAARSLLIHELHGKEPDTGAMKTKVRRLYDICNVLTSMGMLEKVKLPGTCKPAFKWLGVTSITESVFDKSDAETRCVKQYGGGDLARGLKRPKAPVQERGGASSDRPALTTGGTAAAAPAPVELVSSAPCKRPLEATASRRTSARCQSATENLATLSTAAGSETELTAKTAGPPPMLGSGQACSRDSVQALQLPNAFNCADKVPGQIIPRSCGLWFVFRQRGAPNPGAEFDSADDDIDPEEEGEEVDDNSAEDVTASSVVGASKSPGPAPFTSPTGPEQQQRALASVGERQPATTPGPANTPGTASALLLFANSYHAV